MFLFGFMQGILEKGMCVRERVWEINALLQVLKELNSSVRGVIELHINFSHCCCKQHVSEKREREQERREIVAMFME